jgi:hypothetical protein
MAQALARLVVDCSLVVKWNITTEDYAAEPMDCARASKSLYLPLGGTLDISMVPTSGTPMGPTGIYITV